MATATASTGRESDKFMLRFPDGMRALIKEAADKSNRTMNAEIISRLEGSYSSADSAQTKFLLARLQFDLAKQHAETELQAANQRIFALQVMQFLDLLGQSAWTSEGELQSLCRALEEKAKEQISLPLADSEAIVGDLKNRHAQFKAALTEFLDARERPAD